MRSSGSHAGPGPVDGSRCVIATSIPSSGFMDETFQSLPNAVTPPAVSTLAIG